MTVFILAAVGIWGFALAVDAVTRWHERPRRQPSQPTREQADWELHVAEAIRITRGDLDTRINNIRAQIHRNHDREVERFRAEIDAYDQGGVA